MATAPTRADGAAIVDLAAGRHADFTESISFDSDLSSATFAAKVRATPDESGTAAATMTISSPVYSDPNTTFSMSLSKAQMEAMPAAAVLGDDKELYWDMTMVSGGITKVIFAGKFTVLAGVTY